MAHLRFVFFSMIGFLAMTFLSAPSWGQGRKRKEAWWQQLEDATLDSLMEVALRQNGAVHSAWDRVEQARRQLWAQRGAYAPVIGLGGGWTRQQTPGNGGGTLGMAAHSESEPSVGSRTSAADAPLQRSRLSGTWKAQAQLNWEVDVFGRIRRLVSVQQANLQARRADYREAQVTLCAAVATTYLQLREQQQELQVLRRNACSQQAVVEMTEVRFRTGLVSKLDVAQARSVYFSTQAALPAMEASVLRSQHALAVLLGVYPDQVASVLNPVQPLPVFVAPVEVEVPMERLLLRPDVQAAQRQVEVQRAQLGVARSAWWPRLSLQAAWGGQSSAWKDLGRRCYRTWSLVPTLQWTLTDGGQRWNRIQAQRWQWEEVQHQYQTVVLTAMQEVKDAQDTYRNALRQQQACQSLEAQGKEVLTLSLDLYKQGLTPFQNVLDALRSLLAYEQERVRAQGWALQCLVECYKALGEGPMETDQPQ